MLRTRALVGWTLTLHLLTPPAIAHTKPERRLPERFLLGGIQVNEADHHDWAETLAARGMNTVEVTVYARQADWDSANLWWDNEEPAVLSEIRAAKEAGLRVVLILRLALDHAYPRNRYLWHGQVYPRTNADLNTWFDRYFLFVSLWAEHAERERVDVIAIGSELNAMTTTGPEDPVRTLAEWIMDDEAQNAFRSRIGKWSANIRPHHLRGHGVAEGMSFAAWLNEKTKAERTWAQTILHLSDANPEQAVQNRKQKIEQRWRDIIFHVRERFTGPVGYAANFDQYWGLGFWDSLDFVGINAYFSLRHAHEPPNEENLRKGWQNQLKTIHTRLRKAGVPEHPVLFTELGYTQRGGTTLAPWAMAGVHLLFDGEKDSLFLPSDHPIHLGERATAIRALRHAAFRSPLKWAGLLYWKLSTEPAHRIQEPYALVFGQFDPLEIELSKLLNQQNLGTSAASQLRP